MQPAFKIQYPMKNQYKSNKLITTGNTTFVVFFYTMSPANAL